MKEGIKEHLLAIITTCDLVHIFIFWFVCHSYLFFQSFRFVERQAVRGFISYLNPKIGDELIPKKLCMADAVNTRVEQLEDFTIELIGVCVLFLHILYFYSSFIFI